MWGGRDERSIVIGRERQGTEPGLMEYEYNYLRHNNSDKIIFSGGEGKKTTPNFFYNLK